MNFRSLVLSLSAVATSASLFAADDVVTSEHLFPQLDAILKQAVAQSPRMVTRALDLEIAEADRIEARSALLPDVNSSFRYLQTSDSRQDLPGRSEVTKQYYDVSLTQPLFHWGERRNTARIGVIKESMVKLQYRDAYRLLSNEIRTLYLTLILDKLRLQRAEFYRDYAANREKLNDERLAKKQISDAQMFAFRLDAERSQIGAERARFDFEATKASFARLTGGALLSDEQVPDAVPGIPQQSEVVDRRLAEFLAQKDPPTAEAENFRQAMKVDLLRLANQKTRLRPKFNLLVGTNQDEQNYNIFVSQKYKVQSNYAGVSVNWLIFDGFAAKAGVQSARAQVRRGEADYRVLTDRLATQAQNQAKRLSFTVRLVAISDRLYKSSTEGLKTRQEDFNRGVVSEEDVSTARLQNYDNQISAMMTRGDYFNQLNDFLGTVAEDPVLRNLKNE